MNIRAKSESGLIQTEQEGKNIKHRLKELSIGFLPDVNLKIPNFGLSLSGLTKHRDLRLNLKMMYKKNSKIDKIYLVGIF